MDADLIRTVAVHAIPLILAITLHEAAHGYVAGLLGDPTARLLGRVTANPVKHIDPIGTILIPAVLLLTKAGFLFGWAKPVPVAQNNLRNPRRDMGIVAFAGPASNFLMALAWAILLKILLVFDFGAGHFFSLMAEAGILWNVMLALLNLLPIPPLDGGRVLVALLPRNLASSISKVEPFGLFILIGLLVSGMLGKILTPALSGSYRFILKLVGII